MQEQLVATLSHAGHLVARFFGHVAASGLTPHEQQQVHDRLSVAGAGLFWEQGTADQRHAFDVAQRVAAALPNDGEAYAAALLHDVGKRHAGIGPYRRSIATVLDGLRLPLTASMRRYRRHGPIGATDLSAAGFDGLVVAFAAFHPGPPPGEVDDVRWEALLAADGG